MEEQTEQDRHNRSEVIEGLELNEGEIECPKCLGAGEVLPPGSDEHFGVRTCPRCYGAKKLDWIEMATGKQPPVSLSRSSSSSSGSWSSYSYEEGEKLANFKRILERMKRRKENERNNTKLKFGRVQRFSKMSYKLKRNMQRC